MYRSLKGSLLCGLTALIWGVAFVAQSVGMDYVGPFTFNGVRSVMGGLSLLVFQLARRLFFPGKGPGGGEAAPGERGLSFSSPLWPAGIACGVVLFAASSLQQIGLMYTQAGKAGFITALYVVLVPVMGLCLGKRVSGLAWISVGIAAWGLYLLCVKGGFSMEGGDLLVLGSACLFGVHIWVMAHFAPRVDSVWLSCVQFFTVGALSLVFMFMTETPDMGQILACWLPILYAGVLSCGVAYTLQAVAQKDSHPVLVSLILSLESVFAVLAGWVILGETLSLREGLGALLMLGAIVLAQLPPDWRKVFHRVRNPGDCPKKPWTKRC